MAGRDPLENRLSLFWRTSRNIITGPHINRVLKNEKTVTGSRFDRREIAARCPERNQRCDFGVEADLAIVPSKSVEPLSFGRIFVGRLHEERPRALRTRAGVTDSEPRVATYDTKAFFYWAYFDGYHRLPSEHTSLPQDGVKLARFLSATQPPIKQQA